MEIVWRGQVVRAWRNVGHPDQYAFLEIMGQTFFLGVIPPSAPRREVRARVIQWLREHPQHVGA